MQLVSPIFIKVVAEKLATFLLGASKMLKNLHERLFFGNG